MVLTAVLPALGGTKVVPRLGFGPRLIYLVGGNGEGGKLSSVELYDPQAASWTQLAGMTGPRSMHGCVALNGKLYAGGGYGATGHQQLNTAATSSSVEVYNPQTDGWQALAKMTTKRCELGLAAIDGKIYAIGGWSGGSTVDSVEAYDPQLGSWAPVASMSAKRRLHASVVLDGKIYTMGGRGVGAGALDTVEVYDPPADGYPDSWWQLMVSMPQGKYYHAAAAMGGKIYVTGGCTLGAASVNTVCVYDPQADAWTQLASMSTARRCHASAGVGGKLYVFGGSGDEGFLRTAEVYDPASDSWAQASSLTSVRSSLMAIAL